MNGSIMRRRCRGNSKPPSLSDTEYYSDTAGHTVEQPSGDGSAQDAFEGHSASEESDSPVASGSALPPPQPAQPSGELNGSAETDLLDNGNERAWYEFDLSVVLALLSPIVNWLTGSDHVKNILLILLLVFYLHQIIEVPWSLYLASRPRRALHTLPNEYPPIADKYHRATLSELHTLEIFYLTLSILSPFLGATLLRTIVASFAGPSTVSWFSLSLFVLATGMRPWKHGIQRLRQRTSDLHTIIHYPPSDAQKMEALVARVAQLESELKSSRKRSEYVNSEMYEHVEDAIEMIEIAARRQEKKTEVSKAFVEGRLLKLEQNVEALLERVEIRADQPALYRIMAQISTPVSALIEFLSPILPTWVLVRSRGSVSRSPRSSPKMGRSRSSIKLETIPEVATFQPKSSTRSPRYLQIPGLGLALRIGDLATFPLRRIVAYLLAGRIYTPRSHAS
ncbi:hypothetical protein L210DRAFT_3541360 [Boletus edulis BED1]|uniref:Uncharacterized protein n=1 Tax=Boletus edulis BED1 TaxID=1328754 RepID=A0AAD4GEY3_BOLED|nr:hypothetical protein L210DRAFT_3541360 [Boletus edulis BED1]